jgi:hypothetical protein
MWRSTKYSAALNGSGRRIGAAGLMAKMWWPLSISLPSPGEQFVLSARMFGRQAFVLTYRVDIPDLPPRQAWNAILRLHKARLESFL